MLQQWLCHVRCRALQTATLGAEEGTRACAKSGNVQALERLLEGQLRSAEAEKASALAQLKALLASEVGMDLPGGKRPFICTPLPQ